MNKINILFEDNHVIVVYKPSNMLSQQDSTNDPDLLTILKKYLVETYHKPGDAYLGLVHRLDRMTSGIMVYAKTSKAARRLSEAIREHQFQKSYMTICEGRLPLYESVELIHKLKKNEAKNKSFVNLDGKEAILEYKGVQYVGQDTLLEIALKTGRHHQIRAQMAAIGHPLRGDLKYGAKSAEGYFLCAYQLQFIHPVSKEWMEFQVEKAEIEQQYEEE